MPAGVIHFVAETGQSENGLPGKKRLSRINSHVARFSHNRRKNNKNNNSTTVSTISSPLQVDFVFESPRTDDSRSSSDSPKSVTPYPVQLVAEDTKVPNVFQVEPSERRPSTRPLGSNGCEDNQLTRYNSAPVGIPVPTDEDESYGKALARRHSEGPTSFGRVPRIGSMGSTFQLGNSFDHYERYLLNYYFTELPTQMFGFHRDALYCPYRADAARTIQRSPSALHWILVIAEQQMNKYAPEASRSVTIEQSILKRRAHGYGILRTLLNNPNFDLEDAITTLRFAISAECYVFHADACTQHLRALDSFLQQPGILNYFASNIDKTALSLAGLKRVYVNAPIRIKSPTEFDTVRTMIFLDLRRQQTLAKQNQAELKRHDMTTYLMQHDDNDKDQSGSDLYASQGPSQESLLGHYINIKRSTLFSTYTAETMNTTCDPHIKYALQAGLFTLFYGLNMTLASFGKQNLSSKIMFLQRLKSVLDGSSERSLTASAIMGVVDRVREQYYAECFGKEEMVLKEVDMCTYGINVLKIFALLDGAARRQLTTAVRAWLLSDISTDINMEKEDLAEKHFAALEDQVYRAWWKEHLTSQASYSSTMSPEP
ncbi:hypothetical protein A1O7_05124 [Cladophialophora yegresii CBS 114405]|uniref:Uncharacterized protein n=1 Tax=Cladophialophora yegresii CBS 114405 TaxID=1182544 RepID=W9W8W1_9EURO|nr:uncharacterized protein A1O7_05124 [Cladophialophora yegresii CBS 114405]EXJ60971.1 hypothetical protein A1O7_05124 [Cladophialophora yegresii CBS 114405]